MALAPPDAFQRGVLEIEKFEVNRDYREKLIGVGLLSFKDFFFCKGLTAMREVPGRLTVSVQFEDEMIYLKRHWKKSSPTRKSGPHFEAITEWDNTQALHKDHINVPVPMAYGIGKIGGEAVSFYISKEVKGVQGDHFLRDHKLLDQKRKDFWSQLGVFAKEFHSKGYNHRDFYLCHIFVDVSGDKNLFSLIDLQRVQKRNKFRRRWIVKDLGQLFYSFPDSVSQSDKMRFFKAYRGAKKLSSSDKKLLQHVMQRVERMKSKHGEYLL
ncbi:lipopolysaccharide kinase InaA family protein [Lentisphaera marina]|uniref:lipopolysaccharide kinase InaA family protein n=1 Tax=Lentisphaera marina TaxID=1111041 RepID=UPI00236504E6|nr:lipopolysaccharide kinase InaA family protein [Lentisphaera marina]MDD7983423.1 lipopolysaccharide kinase InaA family protein [Lentisphaera marina]